VCWFYWEWLKMFQIWFCVYKFRYPHTLKTKQKLRRDFHAQFFLISELYTLVPCTPECEQSNISTKTTKCGSRKISCFWSVKVSFVIIIIIYKKNSKEIFTLAQCFPISELYALVPCTPECEQFRISTKPTKCGFQKIFLTFWSVKVSLLS